MPLLQGRDAAADRRCTKAAELFFVERFSWELRGQVVRLSGAGAAPPALRYDQLLPGIDGDFVELIAFEDAVCRR